MRALAFLIVIATGLAMAAPTVSAESKPSKVAVVDLVQAIQDHPRTKAVEDNLRKAQQEAKAADDRDAADIMRLKEELDKIEEGNPSRLDKEKRLLQLQNNRKFNAEWASVAAMREYVRALEQIYAAVRSIVGRIARERGYDIVLLKTDPNRKLNSSSPEDFALKSRLRVVVYSDASCDITQAVIDELQK